MTGRAGGIGYGRYPGGGGGGCWPYGGYWPCGCWGGYWPCGYGLGNGGGNGRYWSPPVFHGFN